MNAQSNRYDQFACCFRPVASWSCGIAFSHPSRQHRISFANAATDALVGITNDAALQTDGWMHLAPYGDFPGRALIPQPDGTVKTVPAIQHVDHESVAAMINEFHSLFGTAKRFLSGRKLYAGHPDAPGIGNEYPDKEPRGIFLDLEARSDGLYGKPVLTEQGVHHIEAKDFTSISVYWLANEIGTRVNAAGQTIHIFRPNVFRSAGLTNRPNLPVRHFANEGAPGGTAPQTQPTIMDKSKLIAWLAKHGVSLANESTDEQIIEGLTTVDTQLASLTNERDTAKTGLASQQTAFTNERQARINGALDTAITAGRITPADRQDWVTKLEANFANELPALEKLAPVIKTQTTTGNLGDRKATIANSQERSISIQSRVAEIKQKTGMSFEDAYNAVRKDSPQLFAENQ